MRAVVLMNRNTLEIVEHADPVPGPEDVVVRPSYVGICGTDLELLAGTMPYLASGDASYPLIPGHEWSGVVLAPGSSGLAIGTPVVGDPVIGCGACDSCIRARFTLCSDRAEVGVRRGRQGAFAERLVIPADHLHVVPDGVALRDACLVEPAVTSIAAVDAVLATGPAPRSLVIGAGTVGLVAAQVLRARGSEVTVLRRSSHRDRAIEAVGARAIDGGSAGGSRETTGFDGIVEASGDPSAMKDAISRAAPGATIAVAGVYPEDGTADWTSVVLKELRIVGILNGPGRFAEALEMLSSGALDPGFVIDSVIPVERVAEAYDLAATGGRARPKVLVNLAEWPPKLVDAERAHTVART